MIQAGPSGGAVVQQRPIKQGSADDRPFPMKNAGKVIIVPGYGMAVAPAQRLSQIMSGGSSSCHRSMRARSIAPLT